MKRGEIWWADLPDPSGSEPGHRRPVVVISADSFNRSTTLDKRTLTDRIGRLSRRQVDDLDQGLRLVLGLPSTR